MCRPAGRGLILAQYYVKEAIFAKSELHTEISHWGIYNVAGGSAVPRTENQIISVDMISCGRPSCVTEFLYVVAGVV